MALSNLLNRTTYSVNTGTKGTQYVPGVVKGAFLMLASDSFTQAEADDIQDTLNGRAIATTATRIYKLGIFGEAEDQSSDATTQSFGYGYEFIAKDGRPKFMFTMLNGGESVHKMLRRLNNSVKGKYRIFFVDENNYILWTSFTTSGVVKYRGYEIADFHTPNQKLNTGEGYKYGFSVSLANPTEWNEGRAHLECGFDVMGEVPVVNDVKISIATAFSSGVAKLYLLTNEDQDNFADDYASILAGSPTLLKIRTSSGTAVTVSSIAASAVGGRTTITVTCPTSGGGALPASGNDIIIYGDTVSALNTAGIPGYEFVEFTYTMP